MRQNTFSQRIVALVTRVLGMLTGASFVARTLILSVITIVISGVAHAVAQPAHNDPDAARAVDSIVAGKADLDLVPSEFVDDMGYTPVSDLGTLRNPNGGCSTPGEVGPGRFAGACQTHDLGYDLLRYAEMEGTRLDARARLRLDWRLYRDLLQSCEDASCSLTATAYYAAVTANSIRQGYKAPHAEPAVPWMVLVVGLLGISTAGGLPVMRARFDRDEDRHAGTGARSYGGLRSGRRADVVVGRLVARR